jgi:uncharacterized protein YhaN
MKNIKYILLVLTVIFASGCDTNYSSSMKEVLIPMQKKLVSFYKENGRYPNIKERNILLTQCGCKISKDTCQYSGNSFLVNSKTNKFYEYRIKIKLDNSRCYVGLFKSGNPNNVACYQDIDFRLKQ